MGNFMEGYKRSGIMGARLETAVAHALRQRNTERLGQLLVNLVGEENLFHIHDERLCELLESVR